MTYEEYKNNKNHRDTNNNSFLKNLLSKLITIVVFTFLVIIISNNNPNFKAFIIDKVLNSTFDFSKINKLISNITGIFDSKEKAEDYIKKQNEKQKDRRFPLEYDIDGVKFILNGEENVYLNDSGIVTFIGEKDGYNNTIIIQQSNGYYAWYGNLNPKIKLYDYVEKGTVIGSATDEYYYVLLKDDKPIDINEN